MNRFQTLEQCNEAGGTPAVRIAGVPPALNSGEPHGI